jgi:hypothetical protein
MVAPIPLTAGSECRTAISCTAIKSHERALLHVRPSAPLVAVEKRFPSGALAIERPLFGVGRLRRPMIAHTAIAMANAMPWTQSNTVGVAPWLERQPIFPDLLHPRQAIVSIQIFNECPHDRNPRLSMGGS